jgi:lysozyme
VTHPAIRIAVSLIAGFEGFRERPYRDIGGKWTIGYGATYTPDMRPVTADTPPMPEPAARAWLGVFVAKTLAAVREMVHRPLSDNQVAALVSFAYEEGTAALRRSQLLHDINAGDFDAAASQFEIWDVVHGQVSKGVLARRRAERTLFLGAHDPPAAFAGSAPHNVVSPDESTDALNAAELVSINPIPAPAGSPVATE